MNFINKVVAISFVAVSIFSDCGQAKEKQEINKPIEPTTVQLNGSTVDINSVIVIDMEISRKTMNPVLEHMNKLISDNDKTTIKELHIILNSPGGSVGTGFQFINKMKALKGRGTKITCFVSGLAASMAFEVLVHCDKRIVLSESNLLWHRARTVFGQQPMTGPDLVGIGEELKELDNHILLDLYSSSLSKDMSEEKILYHFNRETFHLGSALCSIKAPSFCSSTDYVQGLLEALNNAKLIRTERPQLSLSDLFGFSPGELIYILPSFFN